MNKYVNKAVRIIGNEIRGVGTKDDDMSVVGNSGVAGGIVCLYAAAGDRNTAGNPRWRMVQKDIADAVGIIGNQIVCL